MIWLGIDYGEARVGLALYDDAAPLSLPRGLGTLQRHGRARVLEEIRAAAERHGAEGLVVGIPLAPDGGRGMRAVQAANFARDLERLAGLVVVLQDERDSTREAMERLAAAGIPSGRRRERVDEAAAVIVLERWAGSARHRELPSWPPNHPA